MAPWHLGAGRVGLGGAWTAHPLAGPLGCGLRRAEEGGLARFKREFKGDRLVHRCACTWAPTPCTRKLQLLVPLWSWVGRLGAYHLRGRLHMPRHSSSNLRAAINESIGIEHPFSIAVTKPDQATMRRSWLGQLAEMLRKSALIKKRRRRATLGELGYPAYFILILWVIKSSLPTGVDYPVVNFPSAVPVEQPGALTCRWDAPGRGQSVPGCDGTNGNATGNNGTWGGSISLGFVNTSVAGEALAQKAVAALGHHARAIGFTSISAMESHARDLQAKDTPTLESKLFYGVEFTDDMLSYTLRFMPQPTEVGVPAAVAGTVLDATKCRPYWKHFDSPGTSNAQGNSAYGDGDSDLDSALPTECESLNYLTGGFLDLQVALDRAVLQSRLGETTQLNVKVQPLPRIEFLTNFASRSTALRSIFSIYLVIPLSSPVRWMTTFLVEEKETKIKEGMLMMGLHYSVFWTVSCERHMRPSICLSFEFPN